MPVEDFEFTRERADNAGGWVAISVKTMERLCSHSRNPLLCALGCGVASRLAAESPASQRESQKFCARGLLRIDHRREG